MPPTSSSPPSPVPFVTPNPTWDEYLTANISNNLEFGVPVTFTDSRTFTSSFSSNPVRLSPAPTIKRKISSPVSSKKIKKINSSPSSPQVGRWTKREHELFLQGLERFGKSWKKISSLVHTRTLVQIRTHAQKYLQKQSRKMEVKAPSTAAEINPSKAAPSQRFAPLAFPTCLSSSTALRTVSTSHSMTGNRLDQLLQEDSNNPFPVCGNEYYTSPTAIEDELLRSFYTNEAQWLPVSSSYYKRRQVNDTEDMSSSV